MQRICQAPQDVKTYMANFSCLATQANLSCPFCPDAHCLRRHGAYQRQALFPAGEGLAVILVVRLLCWRKGRTVSLLPDFCLPRRQHGPGILALFVQALVRGATLIAAIRTAIPTAPAYSTAQSLRDGFLRRAGEIRAYLAQLHARLLTPTSPIEPARFELAVLFVNLHDGFADPVRAFTAHGQRFHRFSGKSLA